MEALSVELGKVIKKHREAAGLSQEDLASGAGIHRTYMGFVERGEKRPTVEVFVRVAVALGVPAWELLKEAEENQK